MAHLAIRHSFFLLERSDYSTTLILVSHLGQVNLNGGSLPSGTPKRASQEQQVTLLYSSTLTSFGPNGTSSSSSSSSICAGFLKYRMYVTRSNAIAQPEASSIREFLLSNSYIPKFNPSGARCGPATFAVIS